MYIGEVKVLVKNYFALTFLLMKKQKVIYPTEKDECVTLVEYLDYLKLQFTHVPNETFTTSWAVKGRNKVLGVRRGMLDYIICVPKNRSKKGKAILLFIEMKRVKGGVLSPEQAKWISCLNEVDNVGAFVCYGFKDAKLLLDKYVQ